jgi:uncharacterized membrane protein YkoI
MVVIRQIPSSVSEFVRRVWRSPADALLNGAFIPGSSDRTHIGAVRRSFLIGMGALAAASLLPAAGEAATEDHERARNAVKSGKILPLQKVLQRISKKYPGKVVDADVREVRNEKTGKMEWLYFLKVLDKKGQVTDLTVDAKTANVLEAKRGGPVKKKG